MNTEAPSSRFLVIRGLRKVEDTLSFVTLILLAIFPLVEVIMRKFFASGVAGSSAYIQHLAVWATFLGGMVTSRNNDHLALTAGFEALPEKVKRWAAGGPLPGSCYRRYHPLLERSGISPYRVRS